MKREKCLLCVACNFPDLSVRCRIQCFSGLFFSNPCICPGRTCCTIACIPCLDGESVLCCYCHFLPMEWMISLESELAFSFHPLPLIVPLDSACKICLNHTNISLIIPCGIQAYHCHYSRIVFSLQRFEPLSIWMNTLYGVVGPVLKWTPFCTYLCLV